MMRRAKVFTFLLSTLTLCLLLDGITIVTLARSSSVGIRVRDVSGTVEASDVEAGSAPWTLGMRKGDAILSVAGRQTSPLIFLDDPSKVLSRSQNVTFWAEQGHLNQALQAPQVDIVFRHADLIHAIRVPIDRMGWQRAWDRDWPLHLVGWIFLAFAELLWMKTQDEGGIINLLVATGVCIACCTARSYLDRDLCLPPQTFHFLSGANYLSTLTAILSLHLSWTFPSSISWLKRHPWSRLIPWGMYTSLSFLYCMDLYLGQLHLFYICSTASLLCLMGTAIYGTIKTPDPLIKLQMKWVALGIIGGFFPWVLLSEIPMAMGMRPVPVSYTLLCATLTPVCLTFAIRRYRLLDVNQIFDWILVQALVLGVFFLVEFALWTWTGTHYAHEVYGTPLGFALNMSVLVFLYAPLRTWALNLVARFSGRQHPPLMESLHKLIEYGYQTGDPRMALEQAIAWTLEPAYLTWIFPGEENGPLLDKLRRAKEGMLGYEFGQLCPSGSESSAWIPVQVNNTTAAIVLHPPGSQGWDRKELRMARVLTRSGELFFRIHEIEREQKRAEEEMQEQREELIRELHDGLGSQLFGASLLSNCSGTHSQETLEGRMTEIHLAMQNALDTLRTGLTVIDSPPRAFGPAILSLLIHAERTLCAANIQLHTEVQDEVMGLQLESRSTLDVLRSMQETFTNAARHSRAKNLSVRVTLHLGQLKITITDDGIGFVVAQSLSGHGLKNVQDRMELNGGEFRIWSAPGQGCQTVFQIPVEVAA